MRLAGALRADFAVEAGPLGKQVDACLPASVAM